TRSTGTAARVLRNHHHAVPAGHQSRSVAVAKRGAGRVVGRGVAVLAAGAGVSVSRRRARWHAGAVRSVGAIADLVVAGEDGHTLASHRAAAGADGAAVGDVLRRAGRLGAGSHRFGGYR